jgi:hypothetical protein
MARFNPVEFYREAAAKPLSVAAPRTSYATPPTAQLSTIGHIFDKGAPLIADYITGEREKTRRSKEKQEMMDVLAAWYPKDGPEATDGETRAYGDWRGEASDREARKSSGPDAANALNLSTDAGFGMLMALTEDRRRQDEEREAAELTRRQTLDDATLAYQRKIEFEGLKGTPFERTLLAAGLKPGTDAWDNAWEAKVNKETTYRPGVVVNTGRVPPGYRVTPEGDLEMIPGGPAAIEAASKVEETAAEEDAAELEAIAEKEREQLVLESTASTQNIMEIALNGALNMLDAAAEDPLSLGASGTMSQIPAVLSSSYAGQLRSYVETLKSPVVMEGIEKLRASSAAGATGFGAMNKEELKILTERLGALNPDTTDPVILRNTLKGIQTQVEIVKRDVLANVPHDRLREIGLGHWIPNGTTTVPAGVTSTVPPADVTQEEWDAMTTNEQSLFR